MTTFKVTISKEVKKAWEKIWDLVYLLEENGDKRWSKINNKLSKLPDKEIDLHDHIGFYPPALVKPLKKAKVDEIIFLCPDDENIYLFYGSEKSALKRINDFAKSNKLGSLT
jgi:hypothetical protein